MTPRILVIDDAPAIVRLTEVALGREDYEVTTELTGEAGVSAAFDQIPDLVILDIALPDISGWEVLTRLRADERTADIPVLIMSAHDSEDVRQRANLTVASSFLGKPFPPEQLRIDVRRLLGIESA